MIYIKRKISKGQTPKDRLEWKQASEYWTKESPVARGNNFNKTVREADIYDYHEIFLEKHQIWIRLVKKHIGDICQSFHQNIPKEQK